MLRKFNVLTLTFLTACSISCILQVPWDGSVLETDGVKATLVRADSCEDLEATLKGRIIEAMEQRLEDNLDRAVWAVTHTCEEWGEEEEEEEEEEEASEYSGTNTQVDDVDEADFVKNDGGYLYVLADGHFWVLDAWPADQAHALSSFAIEGVPRRMYVHADTAVIYSSLEQPWEGLLDNECTYGYDCDFTGDAGKLKMTVLDISDRANPRRTREVEFSGSYLNSRRVGMDVHTAVVFPELDVSGLSYWPETLPSSWCGLEEEGYTLAEVQALFEEVWQSNMRLIQETPVSDLLPSVRDVRYDNGKGKAGVHVYEGPLSSCDEMYLAETGDNRGFLSLVSFAIGDDKKNTVAATTIMSRPGAVYGSKDSLYVAVRHRRDPSDPWFAELDDVDDATTVHRFALNPGGGASDYAASGVVKGRLLNQFAMDEHKEFFRIATTSGHIPSPDVHSTISVLEQQGSELVEVGRIDNLAPTEDIRSVRFRDDLGYVVTFKKTDPLFVLNLSDPYDPFVEGELKIPGFSTYMHPMDEEHLLTMGYDAEDHGNFAYFQGLQLQIIDVTDLANPALLHKTVIGTRGSTSEAATNHLGFTYFKARDLLAVPMSICEGGGGGQYGDLMTFSGLLVFRVTVDGGFTLLGGVPHEPPETLETYSGRCYNWWTDSSSKVKRSVFYEDYVFSVARDLVNVAHLDDLEHPVASIPLIDG